MIEKLMKEGDVPDKDPRYLRAMDELLKAESDLEKCLQNQQPLHALTDAYARREEAVMQHVFLSGFCAAVEVMLDVLANRK